MTLPSLDDLDLAVALDDEDASGAVEGRGDADRIDEAIGHLDEGDLRIAGQLAARPRDFGRLGGDSLRDRYGRAYGSQHSHPHRRGFDQPHSH